MTIHQAPALLQNPGGKHVLEAGPVGSTRLLVNYQGKRKNETATLLHSEYVLVTAEGAIRWWTYALIANSAWSANCTGLFCFCNYCVITLLILYNGFGFPTLTHHERLGRSPRTFQAAEALGFRSTVAPSQCFPWQIGTAHPSSSATTPCPLHGGAVEALMYCV